MTAPTEPIKEDDRRVSDKGLGGKVRAMEERLMRGDVRMGNIERSLATNTAATQEVLEIVTMGRSFFKVLGYVGKAAKWIGSIGAACGVLYAAWTHR